MRKLWLVDGCCWWFKIDGSCGGCCCCCCWCWTAGRILYRCVFTKSTVVFGKSMNKLWWWMEAKDVIFGRKRSRFVNVARKDDLTWPTNNLATIGGYMFSTVISSPSSRFFWMVFAKAVRLYQCENGLRAITILVTNPFVVKAIWRRPLNLSNMRWRCSKSGARSTKLSYQYQVSKEMLFFVCHLSSGPLPDISRVMTPRNYRGYNPIPCDSCPKWLSFMPKVTLFRPWVIYALSDSKSMLYVTPLPIIRPSIRVIVPITKGPFCRTWSQTLDIQKSASRFRRNPAMDQTG